MGITIKHLEGPLADSEQHFGDEVRTIVFGRDPESSQVLYPPEFTTVARTHLALKLMPSGDYVIEPYGDQLVMLDAQLVKSGEEILSGSIIGFGRGEALFEVEIGYRSSYSVEPPARPAGAGSRRLPAGAASPDPPPAASDPVGARAPIGRTASPAPQSAPADLAGASMQSAPSPAPPPRSAPAPASPPRASVPQPVDPPERQRSRAALWWLLAAAAVLGALGYYLFRRSTELGEVIGGAIQAVLS